MVWAGFCVSGVAVATFIMLFDMGQVYRSLIRANGWAMALAGVVFLLSYLIRALRWRILLTPLARLPYGQVRDVLLTGFMVNCLFPARIGELARALVLGRVAGVSRRGALASVGVERIFDGLCLIGILSTLGLLFEVPPWTRRLGHITSLILVVILGVVVWLAFHHRSFFLVFDRALFFLPARIRQRVTGFFERFVIGTRALRSPWLVAQTVILSLLIWGLEIVVYLTVLRGFGIDLPAWSAALALVITNFSIATPSAPGYVGLFEAGCSGAVIALGLDKELALSYAIGIHLLLFSIVVVSGLISMFHLGLRFGDLTKSTPESRDP